MRRSHLALLFGLAFTLVPLVGCGGNSGPAEPATNMSEMEQWLADNPDQNVDDLDEDMEEDLADE